MKIVLVKPPLTLSELYKKLAPAGSELPPLGLATLAAVVRKAGHEVRIVDAAALRYTPAQTVSGILTGEPDVVGITAVTMEIFHAAAIAGGIKQARPDLPVILGGPHVTAAPEETLQRFPDFDLAVIGEGENTFLEWLECYGDGAENRVRGLLLRRDGELVRTPPRPFIQALDTLPMPAWDLLPPLAKKYQPASDSLHRFPSSLLVTSRGCPFQCVFCDRSVFGNKVRGFSADYVLEMMKILSNTYGIRDVFIEDDNFLVMKKRTIEICERLPREKIDMTWSCLGRVDVVNPDMLKTIREGGCWQVNYGCESGAQEILDNIRKGTKVEQVEQAIRWTRSARMDVKGLFMAGSFGETRQTVEKTLAFIRRVPLTDFHMTSFTPLPGTAAYRDAHNWGAFDPDWEKMSLFSAGVFVPHGFTRQDVQEFMARAYRTFYLRPDTIMRYSRKLLRPALYPKLWRGVVAFKKFTSAKGMSR